MSSAPTDEGPTGSGARSPLVLLVEPSDAGQRLDHFLSARLGVSRAAARRLLARGAVRRGGRELPLASKGRRVASGERHEVVDFRPPEQEPVVAAAIDPTRPLSVLAEGPGWIAVAKPAGVAVHPLRPGETGCITNEGVLRHPEMQGVGEAGLRSGVVHRLDVDTSGALLLATQQAAWQRLRAAFAEHRVLKRYRAIVRGALQREGEVQVSLAVTRHRPARVAVVAPGAPGARVTRLSLHPLEALRGATLVEVRPTTGFLHQIRVTLAHLGHPVLGDASYGEAAGRAPVLAPRQLLHAAWVRFEEVEAYAPDPADFEQAVAGLRESSAPPPLPKPE